MFVVDSTSVVKHTFVVESCVVIVCRRLLEIEGYSRGSFEKNKNLATINDMRKSLGGDSSPESVSRSDSSRPFDRRPCSASFWVGPFSL